MKGNKNSSSRLKSVYGKHIAEIVQKSVKGPHIGLISVNEVVVNQDNSLCKVYVTFLGAPHPQKALEELKKQEGYVRSELAKKVSVYKVPEIRFLYDESYDRYERIEKALKKEEKELNKAKPSSTIDE